MAKHINTSQLKSKLRQIEQQQRRAINNYNNAVRKYNSDVKKAVDSYNRFVREYNFNILELFHVLSDGTYGPAGRYEYVKLLPVKKRVKQGINFLCTISA